jgi:GNAT superfamily N-acetyltransferase
MTQQSLRWRKNELADIITAFPEGQICIITSADEMIASAHNLIVDLVPEYRTHTWHEICKASNHSILGNTLYMADISVHPKYRRLGLATLLFDKRVKLAKKYNLKRLIGGGRIPGYHKVNMPPETYINKIITGEMIDPVLSFQLKQGFSVIKILPNYIEDDESRNYATFIQKRIT